MDSSPGSGYPPEIATPGSSSVTCYRPAVLAAHDALPPSEVILPPSPRSTPRPPTRCVTAQRDRKIDTLSLTRRPRRGNRQKHFDGKSRRNASEHPLSRKRLTQNLQPSKEAAGARNPRRGRSKSSGVFSTCCGGGNRLVALLSLSRSSGQGRRSLTVIPAKARIQQSRQNARLP
jgi:hypothetical protein